MTDPIDQHESETPDYSETEIRQRFGYSKAKQLVYKQENDGKMLAVPIESFRLVQLDKDGKVGSLILTLETGETKRICSTYLKEMQTAKFSFDC